MFIENRIGNLSLLTIGFSAKESYPNRESS